MSWRRQKQGWQARRRLIEPLWQKLTSGGWRRVRTPEPGSRDLAQHVLKRQSVRSWGWETGTLLIFTDRIAAMRKGARNGWGTKNVQMEKTKWKSVCQHNPFLKFHPMWFLVKQPLGIKMAHAWINLWSVENLQLLSNLTSSTKVKCCIHRWKFLLAAFSFFIFLTNLTDHFGL